MVGSDTNREIVGFTRPVSQCHENNRVFVAFAGPQPNGKPVKVVYKTNATATDGRSGISKLDDGSFEINSVPFGRKTEGVNPEQLFALR